MKAAFYAFGQRCKYLTNCGVCDIKFIIASFIVRLIWFKKNSASFIILNGQCLRLFLKADEALIPFSHFWLIGKINVLYHALADAREYRGWLPWVIAWYVWLIIFRSILLFFLPLNRTLSLSRIEYTRSSRIHTHSYRDITRWCFRILHHELHYIFLNALAKFSLSPKSFRIKISNT